MSSAFAALSAKRSANGRSADAPLPEQDHHASTTVENSVDENDSRPLKRRRKSRIIGLNARTSAKASATTRQSDRHDEKDPLAPPAATTGDATISSLSESDGLEEESEDLSAPATFSNRPLSSFRPSAKSVLEDTDKEWVVRLGPKDTLSVVGQYDLWVKRGAVSLVGAVLHASSLLHRVYAPSIHAIPIIRPIRDSYGLSNAEVEVSIRSCSTGIRSLRVLSPKFARLWNAHSTLTGRNYEGQRSFAQVHESAEDIYKRPLASLEAHTTWQEQVRQCCELAAQDNSQKVLICGPKGTGKSTFCRMLSNALLSIPGRNSGQSRVFWLDADPGQPEFGPPGDVTLLQLNAPSFGPPFTHPVCAPRKVFMLHRAHHIGALSPREDPKHYLSCIVDLFQCFQHLKSSKIRGTLLINFPSWIQGLGLDLLVQTIMASQPTTVLFTSTLGPEEATEALEGVCEKVGSLFYTIASQPNVGVSRTAVDLREMQTMSYFHLAQLEGPELRWDATSLSSIPPILVPYAGENQAILGVMTIGAGLDIELLPNVLEGSVVGIICLERDAELNGEKGSQKRMSDANLDWDESQSRPNDTTLNQTWEDQSNDTSVPEHLSQIPTVRSSVGIPYVVLNSFINSPLPPSHSHCLGQALIRSIDTINQNFQLITPVPSAELQRLHADKARIILVRGKLDTPTWAYKEDIEYEKAMSLESQESATRDGTSGADVTGADSLIANMIARQPWLESTKVGQRGAKARKVRRDLRYKPIGG